MQKVEQIESGPGWSSWKSGEVGFAEEVEEADKLHSSSSLKTLFFIQDIVNCTTYLLA